MQQGGPPPGGYGAPGPHHVPPPYGYQHQPYPQQPYPQPPYPQPPYGGPMQAMPNPAYGYVPFGPHCPRCASPHLTRPSFTWWGGLIGPKLLNHTVCGSCGLGFNAKNGKPNSTAIGIYLGVGIALSLVFVLLRLAL